MTTLEKGTFSPLNSKDLTSLNEINAGLFYYSAYYLRLTWFNSGLSFKEYVTLKQDFHNFYEEARQQPEYVNLFILNSFSVSLQLLLDKSKHIFPEADPLFFQFLMFSRVTIIWIISDLTKQL